MKRRKNNARGLLTLPLDRRERRHLRHRWHHRILYLSASASVLVVLLAVGLVVVMTEGGVLSNLLSAEEYLEMVKFVLLVFLWPFSVLGLRAFNAAKYSATGAVASEQQFEHVYLIAQHYSRLAGLKHTPMVAIVSSGDFMAKTISNFGKAVILVHADLIDTPRPGSTDWGALRFAIAREVGHIAAGHRDLKYELLTALMQSVPYVRNPLLRAEAYTADRYGAALAPDAATDYFAVDAVSKDCWQDMSIRAAVARAGKVRIGQVIIGFAGKTPPTVWRLQALAWFGVFRVVPLRNDSDSPAEYKRYLGRLPTLPIPMDELDRRHAAFWLPPKPMPSATLDRLCAKGTNAELLASAFAKTASPRGNKVVGR